MIDLRGSARKFIVLVACMALGVAAIGTIGTLRSSVEAAIAADTRAILGGDLEVLSRRADIPDPVRVELNTFGRVSRVVELNTQARVGERVAFLALRAVDDNFPLVGSVRLEGSSPGSTLPELLAERDGAFGLLLTRRAALQLGIEPGASV
ncbi:MAG: ABC transporter permease, partial [Devosia sp.]|nr:ABC transporter permease [Devosia sp.]